MKNNFNVLAMYYLETIYLLDTPVLPASTAFSPGNIEAREAFNQSKKMRRENLFNRRPYSNK